MKSWSRRIIAVLLILGQSGLLSGCSVVMAFKQPDKKDLRVLARGMSRENLITYLGPPVTSDKTPTGRMDMYQFAQGFSSGTKTSRALFHGVMDVATLFIWELIAMPTEAVWDGKKMTIKVEFDEEDKLANYVILKQD